MRLKTELAKILPSSSTEDLALGWFALSHHWLKDKKTRRENYGRLFRIKSEHGTIYRNLRFSPRLKKSQGLFDWAGWIDLSGRTGEEEAPLLLDIRPATWAEIAFFGDSHPDPAYRHSMLLARISLYISFISLIISFR